MKECYATVKKKELWLPTTWMNSMMQLQKKLEYM